MQPLTFIIISKLWLSHYRCCLAVCILDRGDPTTVVLCACQKF